MPRVVRTRSADADATLISWHVAQVNAPAAERWLEDIDATLAILANVPTIGERVDDLEPNLRRFCIGKYVLYYLPIDDGIELRRILHGARKLEDLFP